jgi:general secretion pathway protein K
MSRFSRYAAWPGRRAGSVLVIVLVTILFATVALVAFVEKAGDDLMVEAREAAARRLRKDAYSALEVTLGVLEDFRLVNGALRSPAEGWSEPLAFAGWEPADGYEVEVTFDDESGKLSLPHAELVTLVNLFHGWGMAQTDAERLADALLGWMKKDHVPSSAHQPDYDQGPLPYLAPLRPMRSYSELQAIDYARDVFYDEKGQPTELWHRFVAAVSLFDFKETNLNGLNSTLLSDLGIIDAAQQRQFEDFRNGTGSRARQGPGFFESTADAASVLGTQTASGYGTQISALRINVTGRQGRTEFRLSVVVAPSGGAKAVQEVATNTSLTTPGDPSSTPAVVPSASEGENQAGAKKLNYPFTLLEIKENAEISAVSPTPTKA